MRAIDPVPMRFEPGAPVEGDMIPLCVPEIRGNEWKYVKECLDTGWVSSVGPFVDRFEKDFASYLGTTNAVATVNGTAALHIALLVAGIKPNDEVLVSTLTFIAPVNAIRYVGAWPVFIDAEPKYWQMSPERVEFYIKNYCIMSRGELYDKRTNRRVKAILPVHILGHPVDMDGISEIAQRYNLTIIEDASESLGAKYRNRMVGHLADIACFSFNGNKIITTGGGGMIATDNEDWSRRAKYLTTQSKDDPIEYIHNEIGYNYRLTNIQAAIGVAQLEHINEYINAKRRIAARYSKYLSIASGITPMMEATWAYSAYWMYTIMIDPERFGVNRCRLLQLLNNAKIQARPLWQPIHLSPAHKALQMENCNVAEQINASSLSLPSSVGLTDSQQDKVIETILGSNKS